MSQGFRSRRAVGFESPPIAGIASLRMTGPAWADATRTILALVALLSLTCPAMADASHRQRRRAQPTPAVKTSNETTGSIKGKPAANESAATTDAPVVDEEALPPRFELPVASRKRMRACGEQWQAKKMSGQAGEEIWREFATLCLAAKDDPLDARSP